MEGDRIWRSGQLGLAQAPVGLFVNRCVRRVQTDRRVRRAAAVASGERSHTCWPVREHIASPPADSPQDSSGRAPSFTSRALILTIASLMSASNSSLGKGKRLFRG